MAATSEALLGSYDPALAEALREGGADEEISLIARLSGTDALPEGVRVVTRFGDIATLRVRRGSLGELAACEAVAAMEASRGLRQSADVEYADPDVADRAVADLGSAVELPRNITARVAGDDGHGAVAVREASEPVYTRRPDGMTATGRGVVLGVLDWGCDFAHPAFRNEDGSTRLLALWDQRGEDGTGPGNRWGYGRILTAADIDRALNEDDPYKALGYHPSDSDSRRAGSDEWKGAHGTHVLDIAAGSGHGGGMSGVAPGSDLVFVHLARTARVLGEGNLGDSGTVLEALDFVFSTAEERPCVVNLSVGAHGGPHDGSTLVEQGIDRAVRLTSGRVVVNSAGNYFAARAAAQGRVEDGEERELRFEVPPDDPTDSELELWYPGVDRLAVTVIGPEGDSLATVKPGEDSALSVADKVVGQIYHHMRHATNGDHHVDLFLKPGAPGGEWALRLAGEVVRDGHFHAWIEREKGPRPEFVPSDVATSLTTGTICNGRLSVTCGAYDPHGERGELGRFSSAGPTRDGRVKPEIVAPGVRIRAARSTPPGEAPGARYTEKSGTSMAAPHVAGCIAVMAEAAGKLLEIFDTRALLLASADRTPFTNAPPAGVALHRYGIGCLDIEAAERAARRWGEAEARGRDEAIDRAATSEPDLEEAVVEAGPSNAPAGDVFADPAHWSGVLNDIEADMWLDVGGAVGAQVNALAGHPTDSAEERAPPSGGRFDGRVHPGDLLLRAARAEGIRHSAIVVSDRLQTREELAMRGVPVERAGPGGYVEVMEGRSGGGPRSMGRRLVDGSGRMPRGQLLVRKAVTDERSTPYQPSEDDQAPAELAFGIGLGPISVTLHPKDFHRPELAEALATEERPGDLATPFVGISIRGIGRREVVVLNIERRGANTDIGEIARMLQLRPQVVLREIMRRRANARAVRYIFEQEFPNRRWPGIAAGRRALREIAGGVQVLQLDPPRTRPKFHAFEIGVGLRGDLILPLSQGFRDVIARREAELERERRRRRFEPVVTPLQRNLSRIRALASLIKQEISLIERLTRDAAAEVAVLEQLDGLLNAMLRFPKESPPSDDRRDVERLRSRQLKRLREVAVRDLVTRPQRHIDQINSRDRLASELLTLLESREFARRIRALRDNHAVAPPGLLAETADALRFAFVALLLSPRSEEVMERHVQPLIDLQASRPLDTSGYPRTGNEDFDRAVRTGPQPPRSESVLVMIGGLAGTLRPDELGAEEVTESTLRIIQAATPSLLVAAVPNPRYSHRLAGHLFRVLMNVSNLRPADQVAAINGVMSHSSSLLDARAVPRAGRLRASGGAFFAIYNVVVLAYTVSTSEIDTLDAWIGVIGNMTGVAAGTLTALQRIQSIASRGMVQNLGKFLGVVGSLAASYGAAQQARREFQSGDELGGWLATTEALGSLTAATGFVVAGLASSATVAGLPVGTVLIVIGAGIALVASLVQLVRELTTAGSHRIFEMYLEYFGRPGSAYSVTRQQAPNLRRAFEAIRSAHPSIDFWDVNPARSGDLHVMGFRVEDIAQIVNEDADAVRRRLRSEGLIDR